jgi:hypothetical protein
MKTPDNKDPRNPAAEPYLLDAIGRYMYKKTLGRRGFLRGAGKGAGIVAAAIIGVDQGGRVPELLNPEPPEVVFDPDQQAFLKTSKTAAIIFGPATIRDPGKFEVAAYMKPPFNEHQLPVGYLRYANYGLDPEATARELESVKERFGIERIIGVFESSGLQFVAEAFDRVGDKLRLVHGILDATPLDASTTRSGFLGALVRAIDPLYEGGLLTSSAAAYQVYGTPFRGGIAGPDLAFDQAKALVSGKQLTALYRPRIRRDGTTFSYITTQDPASDRVIEPVSSRKGLEQVLQVQIPRYPIEGKQNHANIWENPGGYKKAITNIIADNRLAI